MYSRIDHMLSYKTSFTRFKVIESYKYLSNHNSMKPENNYKKKQGKFADMQRQQHTTEQLMSQRRNQKRN